MPKKRVVITSSFEASAVIDPGKLARYFSDEVPSDGVLENSLARSIEDGDRTVRGVLETFGAHDTVSYYDSANCEVKIEVECEEHPGNWAPEDGECLQCKLERRGR